MLLKDLCTTEVVCCAPELRVLDAALLMRQKHVGDLVVVGESGEDQTPIGMVTDRDIVVEVLGKGLDPHTISVRDIMRSPTVIARDSDDAAQAIERMRVHGVRRIPVMAEDRKLVGIVSLDDLLRQLAADANALVEVIAREQNREHRTRR
jgi:CBS domain-containing protein